MISKLISGLAILASVTIFLSAIQDPTGGGGVSICAGCFAKTTFDLPATSITLQLDGDGVIECVQIPLAWTITRDIERPGACRYLAGSCIPYRHCLALGTAVVTGPGISYTLSAGVDQCGAKEVTTQQMGDGPSPFCPEFPGGYSVAKVTAECENCDTP